MLRYIHQNPLKAKMVSDIIDYPWSSYGEYIGESRICNVEFALNLFSEDREKAIKLFREFNLAENKGQCLEYNQNERLNDTEAAAFIRGVAKTQSSTEVQNFTKEERNKIIKKCREHGLSIRQIVRLTGVSFGIIRNI